MLLNTEDYVRPHNLKLLTDTERRINQINKYGSFLDIANEYAKSKGGSFLSEEIKNTSTKLLWKCSNQDHKPWEATYSSIVNNKCWCPCCDYERKFGYVPDEFKQPGLHLGIARANYLASKFKSTCISSDYKNNTTPLMFKCSNPNHLSFKYTPRDLSISIDMGRKHICPSCKVEQKEDQHKEFFEKTKKKIESLGGVVLTKRFIQKTNGIEVQFGEIKKDLTYIQMIRLNKGKSLRVLFGIKK